MATTKIWPVRDNLARVVEYAENHLKTANPGAYTAKELKDLQGVLAGWEDVRRQVRVQRELGREAARVRQQFKERGRDVR